MRKLFNQFFYIPKHGKIREKVMLTRAVTTISIMVMCLAAMSITAYAYFSHNVTSGSSIIKTANFEAQIKVTNTNQDGETVNPSSTDGKKAVFTFANTGTYAVELRKGNSTAKTGFCIIYIGNEKYHTQQIGVDINANNSERELVAFDLKINEPNIVVTIESHWGTSSYYEFDIDESNTFYIMNDPRREIVIGNPVNSDSNSDEDKETTSDETTVPSTETTEPAVTTPETMGTSEPTTTTEPSSTTEPSTPTNTTEPAVTVPEEITESTETQPTEETTGAPTTEVNS